MMDIKKYNLNYILIIFLYVLLNIILCIVIYDNFSYIFKFCELLIINKIFYLLLMITILLIIISLFYSMINNFHDKKMLNSILIIITILILIFFILSIYLRFKVDISKSSEVLYNSFLDIKLIKINWSQVELMTIYKHHSIEKGYILAEETILSVIAESKNPEQLIEKLNLIYNTLKETTILDKTLNFLQDHKFKILIGTGVTILGIAGGIYILPILISKFAVAPIIEAVQENPIIEIRPQEHITAEVFRSLCEARAEDIDTCSQNITILHQDILKFSEVLVKLPGILGNYVSVARQLHYNILTQTTCQVTSSKADKLIRDSLEVMAQEIRNLAIIEQEILRIFVP